MALTAPTHRILVNSLPKSGTHLLTKAIDILGYQPYFTNQPPSDIPRAFGYQEVKNCLAKAGGNKTAKESQIGIGFTGSCAIDADIFSHWIDQAQSGQYMIGHIPWSANLPPILNQLNYKFFMMVRDPRAVIGSLLPFILDERINHHFLENDFKPLTPMQRLNFLLDGGYAKQAQIQIQDFATLYRAAMAWETQENGLLLRFEDLVGAQGGGNDEQQQQAMQRIMQHLNIEMTDEINDNLSNIYDTKSRTFRKGSIDGWKTTLDAECAERLDDYCQPLCALANYQ